MKTNTVITVPFLLSMTFLILAGITAFSGQKAMAADTFRVVFTSNMLGEFEPCG
jgi:hypothetical protein